MKKSITFILLSVTLFMYSDKCHAQFLKKLGKSIDKALKTEEPPKTSSTETNGSKMTLSTPHKNLQVNLIGASMNGNYYVLEFTITNKGDDITDYRLSNYKGSNASKAYDNLGNECYLEVVFGNVESWGREGAGGNLLNDIPINVKVYLSGFSAKATSFTQIRVKGEAWDYDYTNRPDGFFTFKNVPIVRNEEVEVTIPVKKATPNNESNNTNDAVEGLNIPETKGIMSLKDAYNQYDNRKRITPTERAQLKVDNIKNAWFDNKWSNSLLSKGKLIYAGEEGTIATLLYVEKDHAAIEFLVSYDRHGNFNDCIPIASISTYGGDRGEGFIHGSKIKAAFYSPESSTSYVEYNISPDLKFVKIKEWTE